MEELLADRVEKKQKLPDLSDIEVQKYHFRAYSASLTAEQVKPMLQKYNFFDSTKNQSGQGIKQRYFVSGEKEQVILDFATGLMWQQSGSPKFLMFKDAEDYVANLNRQKFASFNDWRLPTLEEAMSLMEPKRLYGDLYIDPVFDITQRWIWTVDPTTSGSAAAWVVSFHGGYCNPDNLDLNDNYVRAVRSGLSSQE
ncbi:DUF1566 domain-containing protein [candidate division KSB1 bacterium]|nr:DUF1566 domain-containing protein [candidate division KSB1 bacterium]